MDNIYIGRFYFVCIVIFSTTGVIAIRNTTESFIHSRNINASKETLIYVHIPKSAGFTVRKYLKWYFLGKRPRMRSDVGFKECAVYCNCKEGLTLKKPNTTALFHCDLIYGHFDFSLVPYMLQEYALQNVHSLKDNEVLKRKKKVVLITMLRHPVSRIASEYHYIREHRRGHIVRESNITLEEYVSRFLPREGLTNLMVKQISGIGSTSSLFPIFQQERISIHARKHVDLAKSRLQQDFAFFGLQERFNDSMKLLRWTLFHDQQNHPSRVRASHKYGEYAKPTLKIRRLIEKTNPLDIELFNYALTVFNSRLKAMNNT